MINIDEFKKVELQVGTVLEVEEVEGSEKLLKLKVDLGDPSTGSGQENSGHDIRQILSGIKAWYKEEDLVGKQLVIVANLEPRMIMGLESQGMILAAGDEEDGSTVLTVIKPVKNGSKIR